MLFSFTEFQRKDVLQFKSYMKKDVSKEEILQRRKLVYTESAFRQEK